MTILANLSSMVCGKTKAMNLVKMIFKQGVEGVTWFVPCYCERNDIRITRKKEPTLDLEIS